MKEGTRVQFQMDYELYPTVFGIKKGDLGTIEYIDEEFYWVIMDNDFDSYEKEYWENAGWPERGVQVYRRDETTGPIVRPLFFQEDDQAGEKTEAAQAAAEDGGWFCGQCSGKGFTEDHIACFECGGTGL